ncbi:MAG: D-lyxose/D-mannose family sugar isomerase, partial [Ruthenibacterium sp.]
MNQQQYEAAKKEALCYYDKAGIFITPQEKEHYEVADFGLNDWRNVGLNIVTYVNTERCCAKEMVLLPGQTCPEHSHIPFGEYPGKEETFRCRMGVVYVYVDGEPTQSILATVPQTGHAHYHVFHEIILHEGEQYTMQPNTRHWF